MERWPSIDPRVAGGVGRVLTPASPRVSAAEASETVASLREAAAASEAHASELTGLAASAGAGETLVVDRASWVDANVALVEAMLAEASGPDARDEGRLAASLNGAQVGAVLGVLSSRILGQYVPLPSARLLLVAPNVLRIERELGVAASDFRLWVCLHEQTHRLQFAAAPWLRAHLAGLLGELIAAEDDKSGPRRGRPASVIDLVTTPAQRVVLDRVNAAMSLLEGYADVMMDLVGPGIVPSVETIRTRFDAHRRRGGWALVVNRLLALDVKLAQYRDGASFCRAVIDRVGIAGLNAVWAGPDVLPTLDEIHAPERWLDRVGPDSVAGVGPKGP